MTELDGLQGPPDFLTVNYEIQRLQAYHDRLTLLSSGPAEDEDLESINAFLEGFLVHFRNLLDFFASKGGEDDIKATDFVPGFTSKHSPEEHRVRINKMLAHLSRSRPDYPKAWEVGKMVEQMREAWFEFVAAVTTTIEEE